MINYFLHVPKSAQRSGIEAEDDTAVKMTLSPAQGVGNFPVGHPNHGRPTPILKLNQDAIDPKHWPKITNIHRDVFEPFDLLAQLPQLDDNMQAPGTDSDEMEDVMLEDSAKQQEPVQEPGQEPGQEPVQEPPKKKGRQKPLSQKTLASISETVDAEMESIFNSVTTGAAVARKEGANDGGGNASK